MLVTINSFCTGNLQRISKVYICKLRILMKQVSLLTWAVNTVGYLGLRPYNYTWSVRSIDTILHLPHHELLLPLLLLLLLLLLLHTFNGLLSRTTWVSQYQKGKTSMDLNEARDDGVLGCSGISWTICKQSAPRSQTDNHTNTSSLSFYRPGGLPDTHPTVSKHWKQYCIITKCQVFPALIRRSYQLVSRHTGSHATSTLAELNRDVGGD